MQVRLDKGTATIDMTNFVDKLIGDCKNLREYTRVAKSTKEDAAKLSRVLGYRLTLQQLCTGLSNALYYQTPASEYDYQ
jgi:hypothetical protein